MALHSISEAARLTGKARSTLHRHLAGGRLSKTIAPDGSPAVETSELVRAYGLLHLLHPKWDTPDCPIGQSATPLSDTPDTLQEPAHGLRQEVDALRLEKVQVLERRVVELEAERDAWKDQAEAWREQARVALLRLPMPAPVPSTPPATAHGGVPDEPLDPAGGRAPIGRSRLLTRLWRAMAGHGG